MGNTVNPLEQLAGHGAQIIALNRRLEEHRAAIPTLIAFARRQGATWQQIGDALGMSRQAAHVQWADAAEAVDLDDTSWTETEMPLTDNGHDGAGPDEATLNTG